MWKTTLGRIIAKELGCKGSDFREIDSADFRGIDTIREIRKQCQYKALESPVRVFLIDECFAKGTKVTMADGKRKNIEKVRKGEIIRNLSGSAKVSNTFINKIPLSRIGKLHLSNHSSIICSEDHLFLTANGWKKAKELTSSDLIFQTTFNKIWTFLERIKRISSQLQGRFGFSSFEIGSGSRWNGTSAEKAEIKRQKERRKVKFIRVESFEIYKRGNNDKSFQGIIGNKERNQGYVNLFDLEIEGHPSYFANGVLVHNCHKMTNDAQNALLKVLEDPPKHVYFVLATTEPQKLIPTIKGRCSQYQVSVLTEKEMLKLLRQVVKQENQKLEKEIYYQIIQDSQGHPRNALQILEQVLDVEPEKRLEVAKRSAERQSQTIELCRALTQNLPWGKIAPILSGLKQEEPESIRRAILGYCNSILLKGDNQQAAIIMEEMIEPFYNTGFPGLTFACYSIVNGGE